MGLCSNVPTSTPAFPISLPWFIFHHDTHYQLIVYICLIVFLCLLQVESVKTGISFPSDSCTSGFWSPSTAWDSINISLMNRWKYGTKKGKNRLFSPIELWFWGENRLSCHMCVRLYKCEYGCDYLLSKANIHCNVPCASPPEVYLNIHFYLKKKKKYIDKYIENNEKWQLFILSTVSSIFTVPNVRLQPESGESMRAFGKNNSYGKSLSNSKHWWTQHSQESTGKIAHFPWKIVLNRCQIVLWSEIVQLFPYLTSLLCS